MGNPMLQVERIGQRLSVAMTAGSGRNGLDLQKFMLSVYRKRRQIEVVILIFVWLS